MKLEHIKKENLQKSVKFPIEGGLLKRKWNAFFLFFPIQDISTMLHCTTPNTSTTLPTNCQLISLTYELQISYIQGYENDQAEAASS